MLVAAVVLIVVGVGIGIGLALAKANPKEFEREMTRAEELEAPPRSQAPPGREPMASSGGAHGPLPSEAGRASPKHLDLPRLG